MRMEDGTRGIRPAVTIERMTIADLEEVLLIEEVSFPVPWSRRTFLTELSAPPFSCLFVARPAGARSPVIGYVCCWVISDEMHLLNLVVRPEHRGSGIGEELLRYVIAVAQEQGAKHGILEVRASNMAARRLYEQCGFRVAAVRPSYYTNPQEDAVIMSCVL